MGWPTLIELYNSEYSHSYDGSEVRETWYVEPYDALTAFCASMVGRVDAAGRVPNRTLPATHFLYPWCLAIKADAIPLDPKQLSYMGYANLSTLDPLGLRAAQTTRVQNAVQSEVTHDTLWPETNIDAQFMSQSNADKAAGAYIQVTYEPIIKANNSSPLVNADMDFVNYHMSPLFRKNVPNAGLQLITPGADPIFYPNAGIAPELEEEYQEVTVERRMLLPDFDVVAFNQYINKTNNEGEHEADAAGHVYESETLRYHGYDYEWVQVPAVNDLGEPAGFSRWLNVRHHYYWRTMIGPDFQGGNTTVGWNHVLAYPGTIRWLLAGFQLGWYRVAYSSAAWTADMLPYPNVGPGNSILAPLSVNQ